MITYQNLYLDVRRQLLQAGFPGAGLEAREIVCFGSGKTREEFYRDSPLYTSPEIEEAVRALAERHTGGEPVAYLIGEWEFYGLTLEVTPAVLIPRADTEVLAEAAVEFAGRMERCRLLDLCTGSGCVGLAAAANVPGCRVLLVEDNDLNAEIATEILEMMNLTVERAENGLAAVQRFTESPQGWYDLIFMDIRMPVMNGYESTSSIRRSTHPDATRIPIVAMTANAFAEDVRDAENAGMNAHIAKPLEIEKLRDVLGHWLKK